MGVFYIKHFLEPGKGYFLTLSTIQPICVTIKSRPQGGRIEGFYCSFYTKYQTDILLES